MLRAEGLVKTYRGPSAPIPVLNGIDLSVGVGELAVIAGASGSGKSTLLSLIWKTPRAEISGTATCG